MKLLKLSLLSFAISLALFGASYLLAGQLPEAARFNFPESIARHYAKSTGGPLELGNPTVTEQSIPLQNGSVQITELDLETTAVDIQLVPSSELKDEVSIELRSNKVSAERPILIDLTRGQVARIVTDEVSSSLTSRSGWMVFNFDNGEPQSPNGLTLKVPESIESIRVRTTSGDLKTFVFPKRLHFQSESGDIRMSRMESQSLKSGVKSGVKSIETLSIETVSGDLKTDSSLSPLFQSLKFNSVSGDIQLSSWNNSIESIYSQTVSGDFKIQTPTPIDASVSFESTSGEFKMTTTGGGEQKLKPSRGQPVKTVLGKGTTQIVAVSVSGDFKIENDESNDED